MPSCLSRRQRACLVAVADERPRLMVASLAVNHSHVALARSRGTSSRGSGRNRRRGSPFAALSDAFKPPRVMFPASAGRIRGEEFTVRSPMFTWPVPLERVAPDPRHLQKPKDRSSDRLLSAPIISSLPTPLRTTEVNAIDNRQVESINSCFAVMEEKRVVFYGPRYVTAAPADGDADEALAQEAVQSLPTSSIKTRSHRRRVTWSGKVDVIDVARKKPCEVFSPDLYSVEIAKRLAVLADEPELTRAVEAVVSMRRQAAGVVRSLTAREGWNGSLDGVEEACRLLAWREGAYLQDADDIVRCVVSVGRSNGGARGSSKDDSDLWRLKESYRAARRRMENAETD